MEDKSIKINVSQNSILIIDKNGNMVRLYCPFIVIVILPVKRLTHGEKW